MALKPTLAQKLCNEIVEPALNPSSNNITIARSKFMPQNQTKTDGKPTRTIVVAKKRVINKLTPHPLDSSKTVVNKLKSKETFLRKLLVDISTNTLITGPLKCDNDCITMVRRRDNNCSCKYFNKKHCSKASSKQIQTANNNRSNFLMDKACAQYIDTVSCGTQYLGKLSTLKVPDKSQIILKASNDVCSPDIRRNIKRMRAESLRSEYKSSNIGFYLPNKRWALSQYQKRGPDF